MKPLARCLAGSLPLIALAAIAAAGPAALEVRAGDPCYHGFTVPEPTVASGGSVQALACAFSPTVAVVEAGEPVTFRNGPEAIHLVTGANGAWGSRDAELAPNAALTVTFEEPGVYPYACALHRGMSGAIVVGDGGAALAAAMAPAAALPSSTARVSLAPVDASVVAPPVDTVPAVGVGAGLIVGLGAMVLSAVAIARRRGRDAG